MTPHEIVRELDRYIVGQPDAKRAVAVALRNRWRRQQVEGDLQAEISPSNIVLVGPTGVGKTEIARRLAKLASAPFVKVEASKFTEVGYVGRDVESMVRDLLEVAIGLVRDEFRQINEAKAKERAAERLLDLLFPPPNLPRKSPDELTDDERDEEMRRESNRDKLRVRLRDGDLDHREVEIEVTTKRTGSIDIFSSAGMEQMGLNLQEMMGGGAKKTRRKMPVSEARQILEEEELEALLDQEAIVNEARERTESSGIIFVDEIDKIIASSSKQGPDVSREGVQRDLLPIVEGSSVTTKHGVVKTDHILFVAAGAFHGTTPTDLIPELQGRFPIRVELSSLGREEFVRILKEPENALLKQYQALLLAEKITLEFTDDSVEEIAAVACTANESEDIGARRLQTVMAALLEPYLFDVPDTFEGDRLTIDAELVRSRLGGILHDEDVRQYIL